MTSTLSKDNTPTDQVGGKAFLEIEDDEDMDYPLSSDAEQEVIIYYEKGDQERPHYQRLAVQNFPESTSEGKSDFKPSPNNT